MITLHGIKNCDTVRKARRWLQQHDITHEFRDVRESPPSVVEVERWLQQCDWQTLLNKRSTTWKNLEDCDKAGLTEDNVAQLLAAHPTLIKRPLLCANDAIHVGFSPDNYQLWLVSTD